MRDRRSVASIVGLEEAIRLIGTRVASLKISEASLKISMLTEAVLVLMPVVALLPRRWWLLRRSRMRVMNERRELMRDEGSQTSWRPD